MRPKYFVHMSRLWTTRWFASRTHDRPVLSQLFVVDDPSHRLKQLGVVQDLPQAAAAQHAGLIECPSAGMNHDRGRTRVGAEHPTYPKVSGKREGTTTARGSVEELGKSLAPWESLEVHVRKVSRSFRRTGS